ncbi:MAG: hypothetical protein KDI72_13185 [Xanthomonadales bacterium]|nr:hypothetical protein [Xanthomonadales bacterium]
MVKTLPHEVVAECDPCMVRSWRVAGMTQCGLGEKSGVPHAESAREAVSLDQDRCPPTAAVGRLSPLPVEAPSEALTRAFSRMAASASGGNMLASGRAFAETRSAAIEKTVPNEPTRIIRIDTPSRPGLRVRNAMIKPARVKAIMIQRAMRTPVVIGRLRRARVARPMPVKLPDCPACAERR